MYREYRHDAMQSARLFKKVNEPVYMDAYLQQAIKYHNLIMKFRQNEINEHNEIMESMRKYGIIPDYSIPDED